MLDDGNALGAGGREFESRRPDQRNQSDTGRLGGPPALDCSQFCSYAVQQVSTLGPGECKF